jgi:ParB family chromosome partitioning protein
MTATTTNRLELVYVDPKTLLVDRNVRLDARVTPDFVESIQIHGVLQPIVAVRTPDGQLRVKFGHRRTLGAIQAEQADVGVLVAGDEATDDPAQIDRILTQIAENDDRSALTSLDRVNAVEQLAAFDLSAVEIAQRTRRDVDEVTAALRVGKSQAATDLAGYFPDVDLERLAAIAEFDDDVELATQLAAKSGELSDGQWQHELQRRRDERNVLRRHDQARAKLVELLAADGIDERRIIERPSWSSPIKPLGHLAVSKHDKTVLTVETHKECPGHVAYLDTASGNWNFTQGRPGRDGHDPVLLAPEETDYDPDDEDDDDERDVEDVPLPGDEAPEEDRVGWARWYVAGYACMDPKEFGHHDRMGSSGASTASSKPKMAELPPAEQEKARAERKDVIDSNKAWKAATTVRLRWLREFLTRKTPPKGSGAFIASVLAERGPDLDGAMRKGNELAHDLLGLGSPEAGYTLCGKKVADAATKASDARAQVIALGYVLACCEDQTDTNTWRRKLPFEQTYFRFLAACGYELSDVEKRVIDGEKATA